MTDETKRQLCELKQQGMSYRQIARMLGIPAGSVCSFFSNLAHQRVVVRCRCCGRKVPQTKGHRKKEFCDEDCRRWWRKENPDKRKLNVFHTATCAFCGKEFKAYETITVNIVVGNAM